MAVTIQKVSNTDPVLLEMWEPAWQEMMATNPLIATIPSCTYSHCYLIYSGDSPAGFRAYDAANETQIYGRLTYVKPDFRNQGMCSASWALIQPALKAEGFTHLCYTVAANAIEMKDIVERRQQNVYFIETYVDPDKTERRGWVGLIEL